MLLDFACILLRIFVSVFVRGIVFYIFSYNIVFFLVMSWSYFGIRVMQASKDEFCLFFYIHIFYIYIYFYKSNSVIILASIVKHSLENSRKKVSCSYTYFNSFIVLPFSLMFQDYFFNYLFLKLSLVILLE